MSILCVGAGVTTEADKMLSRFTRLGTTLPRILANSGVRFVSQSQKSASAGSATLSELLPPQDTHDHGEVNHYVKVSYPTQQTVWIRWRQHQLAVDVYLGYFTSGPLSVFCGTQHSRRTST